MNKIRRDVIERALNPMSYVVGDFNGIFDEAYWDRFISGTLMLEDLEDESKFPKVNVSEDEGTYIVEIAAAGFSKEEVSLELKDTALLIRMEKLNNEVAEDVTRRYIKKEISTKSFRRLLKLPSKVEAEGIKCTYDINTGIIICTIPKKSLIGTDFVKIAID